jgi:hypothetical protein
MTTFCLFFAVYCIGVAMGVAGLLACAKVTEDEPKDT